MGFFKNIGNAVKKGLKQVSLKNIVKIGTPLLSMVPIVGGLAQSTVQGITDANEMKKQARQLESQGKIEEAQALQANADFLAKQAGAGLGQVAGNSLNAFTKGATQEFVASLPQSVNTAGGQIGAAMVDSTIKVWFTNHWKHLLIGVLTLGTVFFIWKRNKKPVRRSSRRY